MTHIYRYFTTANAGRTSVLVALALASGACASWNRKEQGAVVGAGTGAVVGGVIGNNTGSTARGAIIGAVIGGAAGAIIGHQMDQQAKELENSLPGAAVERVGEGIQLTFESGLLYDFDSDVIKTEAGRNLQTLATSLQDYPDTELLIVGHTDSQGDAEYNQALSTRRAASAQRYLIAYGVLNNRLQLSGRGEWEPIATNDTEDGRRINRRIEVAIYRGVPDSPAPLRK